MHVYWDEFTITSDEDPATGNAARDKVQQGLNAAVQGNASTTPARVNWRGRFVSSELVAVAIRALIEAAGELWTLSYKPSRRIKRASEGFHKLDIETAAQREALNGASSNPPIYAIVGCGAAATVNHTTLRQTVWGRERVGDAEIVHVGFDDPWRHYNEHHMGQFPQLLGLPGYEWRPDLAQENPRGPRSSTNFAAETHHELGRINERLAGSDRPLRVFPQCVALIQARDQEVNDSVKGNLVQEGLDIDDLEEMLAMNHAWKRGRYRLLLVDSDGDLEWGYADKIDICTGAGKARTIDESMATPEVRAETYTKIWEPPESWDLARRSRPIMSGTEALYRQTLWPAGKRVCIMGSGGVGVNMIERADATDCFADWLATQTLHASFVIGRNDILLKHPLGEGGAAMQMDDFVGRDDQLAPIDPKDAKWRFGQGTDIGSVELVGGEDARQVQVSFVSSARRYQTTPSDTAMKGEPIVSRVRDHGETETELDQDAFAFSELTAGQLAADYAPNVYDRVIRAAGQDIRDVGQSEQLVMQLELEPITNPADGRMVGLQTADGSVRLLGAAATGNAQLVDRDDPAAKKMRHYHGSLPAQGQIIFVGFVFSALNVATANHYFDADHPNRNVNTVSEEELETLWGSKLMAAGLVRLRKRTQSGFVWHRRKALLLVHECMLETMTDVLTPITDINGSRSEGLMVRYDAPPELEGWRITLMSLGLPLHLAWKVIRAHVRKRGLDSLDNLVAELEAHEESDVEEFTIINEQGLIAIAAFVSPLDVHRQRASEVIGEDSFVGVFCDAPQAVC
ncbi:MAG: adenylyl-sulfate kinase, partial [Nannocystaceae bacterium]|nr:adenylyl-sulfate kinase [Nannocystaceae bacterium]